MKAKRGQILIFALVAMAVGLIVISPMLYFLESSSTQYLREINRTTAYYTTDAMMENILGDIYSGVDVLNQNLSTPYNLLNPPNGSGYLNSGYNVSVSINNSITQTLPPPAGAAGWIYLDPGILICNTSPCDPNYLLGSLGAGLSHNYSIYLAPGNVVGVNWQFDGHSSWCLGDFFYYPNGSIQIRYPNQSVAIRCAGTNDSCPVTLGLNYSVPVGGPSGNYTIQFTNEHSHRHVGYMCWFIACACYYDEDDYLSSTAFSGVGEADHTWIRVGTMIGGQVYSYQDYMITATAKDKNGRNMVSITAVVRSNPGPLAWWKQQTVEIPGWQITYYQ